MRRCGPCKACCKATGVVELDKAPGVMCKHACAVGCGIYDERPSSCIEYRCSWLRGSHTKEERPDRIGLVGMPWVVDQSIHPDGQILCCIEVHPGSGKTSRAQRFIRKINDQGFPVAVYGAPGSQILVYYPDGVREVFGPSLSWEQEKADIDLPVTLRRWSDYSRV